MRKYLPHTLYGQLLLSQLLLFGLATIIFPAILLTNLHKTADDFIGNRLRADAATVKAVMLQPGGSTRSAVEQALGPLYHGPQATRAYFITDEDGRTLLQGGVTNELHDLPVLPINETSFLHRGKTDLFTEKVRIGDNVHTIAIAQDRTRPEVIVDDVVDSFLRHTLWVVPTIFLISTLISIVVIRRMTASLRRVAVDADRISPNALDVRLEATHLPLEVRSLALATNRALDRVEEGFDRQANFVSSIAHELRTPLALVALRCDALAATDEKEALRRAINQTTHVVSQLMELATIENGPPRIAKIDMELVAYDAVESSAPLVYRSGRTIEVMNYLNPAEHVTGNDALLRIALANLVDNAVRHTPEGTHIVVAAVHDAIFVSDNGPGITVDGTNAKTSRYRSAGKQRSDSAGLGLAIVQRIMAAMGGTMTVVPNAPGTCIRLQLNTQI